jgi:hypothetical protein
MLNIPHYKETIEIERDKGLFDKLFGKKDADSQKRRRKRPDKGKKVWETIKDIFKKKK